MFSFVLVWGYFIWACYKFGEDFVIDIFLWKYGAKIAIMYWFYVSWGIVNAVWEFL